MISRVTTHNPFAVTSIYLDVFDDDRGRFMETFHMRQVRESLGGVEFVQENESFSKQGVLRGLHYQIPKPQGKLVRVVSGWILDVVVDLVKTSPTFGKWFSIYLLDKTPQFLWVPPGYAHGFLALEDSIITYKVTDYYDPACERCIRYDDSQLGIAWYTPINTISDKDKRGVSFKDAEVYE